MARLGFVGLGRRGAAMAERLRAAGHDLVTYDADPARNQGGAKSAADVAAATEMLFLCVTDTEAVASVAKDVACVDGRGKLLIDHSTIHPERCRALAVELRAANGMGWVDAPTSGPLGSCAVFLGGDASDIERVRPFLAAYGNGTVTHFGPVGSGQLVKVASQYIIGRTIDSWREAIEFMRTQRLDPRQFVDACAGAGSDSAVRGHFGPQLLAGGIEFESARNFAAELQIWRDLRKLGSE
jgi:3-hydroxyisobutyrate dehydrogenase